MAHWTDLTRELDRWAEAGLCATFWWRDDDAEDRTPALDRLLGLARSHDAGVAIAVVPSGATPGLAERLAVEKQATVVQHGYAHRNHAAPHKKKAELGADRPAALVLGELARGALALDRLFGDAWLRVMVPPHNRIADALAAALPAAGYIGVSTFGRKARAATGLAWINTHVDIMNWTTTRAFVGESEALQATIGDLTARRAAAAATTPTGLLTHHLIHDDGAWNFIDRFLGTLNGHPAARIVAPRQVFAA